MTSHTNPDQPVVVDALYDRGDDPGLESLRSVPALNRPRVTQQGKVSLEAESRNSGQQDPPGDMIPADMDQPPFCFAGRLNVHWSSADKDVHGSAQFIAPELLLTAAHCVHWSGQWNKNLYFLRRYHDGNADSPIFKIDKIGVLAGWVEHTKTDDPATEAWAYDLAILKIRLGTQNDHIAMEPLTDDIETMTSLGYPEKYDDGQKMYHCTGQRTDGIYPGVVGLKPNHMGFGASGGAWFSGYGSEAKVVGINSFKMQSDQKTDYSPHFSDAAMALIKHMNELD